MPKPAGKTQSYSILLTRSQAYCINVDTSSPEKACAILQRKIAGMTGSDVDLPSIIFTDTWADPTEKGEEWIVAPASQSERNPDEVMTWNGKSIKTHHPDRLYSARPLK